MDLNNLSMNYKIILGISSLTILILVFQYIKNLFKPKKVILEGVTNTLNTPSNNINNNNNGLNTIKSEIFDEINNNIKNQSDNINNFFEKFKDFHHKHFKNMYENKIPNKIKKKIIHLSSIDFPNNEFNLASPDISGLDSLKHVINFKLLEAQIPYVPHNIYNSNNILKFNSSYSVTINEGHYTIYSLLNTINNKLSASGSNISLTFNNITKFITINNPNTITIDTTSYPLFKKLGFESNTYDSNITATNIPDLSIHYLDIIFNDIPTPAATHTTNNSNILKRIPFNGQPGDIIYYRVADSDYLSQEAFYPGKNIDISTIKLNFKRNDGTEYDFKGLNYDLKIEVTEVIDKSILIDHFQNSVEERDKYFDTNYEDNDLYRTFKN